jgi:predicted CoA-binding protein
MKNFSSIPDHIRDRVRSSTRIVIWPIDENPMSDSYQIGRYFQDEGWYLFPIHEFEDRILDVICYRDIRLIPEDYDILYVFCDPDRLPIVVNEIFNADYQPPLVWTHEGIIDLESRDRLTEAGIMNVMDFDLRDYFEWQRDRE